VTQSDVHVHNVDVDIQEPILEAARARLELINKAERETYGVVRTRLADIGRTILAEWEPPKRGAPNRVKPSGDLETRTGIPLNARNRRQFGGRQPTKPLRFTMAAATYRNALARLEANGMNVTRALDEGLEHFARTGKP